MLNQASRPDFSELPFVLERIPRENLDTLKDQYRKLPFVDWKEEECFKEGGIPSDTEQFWVGVSHHKSFKELSAYSLTCLTTPVSNAVVERMFSLVTSVKTKARNRMQLGLLDAIIRIRANLLLTNKCCKDFTVTPQMLSNMKSDIIYGRGSEETVENDNPDLNLDLFL